RRQPAADAERSGAEGPAGEGSQLLSDRGAGGDCGPEGQQGGRGDQAAGRVISGPARSVDRLLIIVPGINSYAGADQSTRTPVWAMTRCHLAASSLTKAFASAGVPPTGSAPRRRSVRGSP